VDARTIYSVVKEALAEIAGPDVRAIAISSFGEAVVLLGKDDSVLSGSIYYSDVRGVDEIDDIKGAMDPEEVLRVTGMPVGPMFSAAKLLWIRKNDPDLYAAAEHKMLFGDYISFMLTGERAIDYSLASRTMLFDIHKKEWAHDVAEAIGLDVRGFSRPVQSGSVLGCVRKEIAGELGLPADVVVVAGGHDQPVAALGAGALLPGESVDVTGGSECLTVVLGGCDTNPLMTRYGFCCEPHVLPGTFVTLAFNPSAGAAMKWYMETFEAERLGEELASGENVYAILDAEMGDDPTDILFLPYVSGSGTPWFDLKTGGAFIGLHQSTKRPEIYKSILEGATYEIKYNETLLEKCGLTFRSIIAAGGAARSARFLQIKADIMNRRIDALEDSDIGAVGLAFICAKALGDIDDIVAAAKANVRMAGSYEPDARRAEHYARKLREYRGVYTSIKSLSSMPSSAQGMRNWRR
jgi:xylulokinase